MERDDALPCVGQVYMPWISRGNPGPSTTAGRRRRGQHFIPQLFASRRLRLRASVEAGPHSVPGSDLRGLTVIPFAHIVPQERASILARFIRTEFTVAGKGQLTIQTAPTAMRTRASSAGVPTTQSGIPDGVQTGTMLESGSLPVAELAVLAFRCKSAWKSVPAYGVISVETGPTPGM